MVPHMSDDELMQLRRGGHDPQKVYNAYKRAMEHGGRPTVILAHTVKGYGLGEAGEGRNTTHQQKKLNEQALDRTSARASRSPFPKKPRATARSTARPTTAPKSLTCTSAARKLGGFMPQPHRGGRAIEAPPLDHFDESLAGSTGRDVSSTMALRPRAALLLKHPEIGKLIVPIIPDEGRTFGMESLFRQFGIYASQGQLYKPHDQDMLSVLQGRRTARFSRKESPKPARWLR